MSIFHAVLLGLIEGLTEFIPVSSTAHLVLFAHALGIPDSDFLKTFEIGIQLGAIIAVAGLYIKRFLTDWETNKRIVVAFIPTAVIGLVLYKFIKGFLLSDYTLILWTLVAGGILLILFEALHVEGRATEDDVSKLSYKKAFLIGCAQSLAIIPGVSRSGATIVGGMLLGVTRRAIVEFSFLLAVPTMIAATGYDLYKSHATITGNEYQVFAIGFIAALVAAYASVKLFLDYIKKHSFTAFGVYRIVFAIALFLLFTLS